MFNKGWLSGFFDGEGCISVQVIFRKGRKLLRYALSVFLTQNDYEVLASVQKEYGGAVSKNGNGYRWRVVSLKARRFLEDILPYSIVKKEQVKLGIKFAKTLRHENLGSVGLGQEVNSSRANIASRLRVLKHTYSIMPIN